MLGRLMHYAVVNFRSILRTRFNLKKNTYHEICIMLIIVYELLVNDTAHHMCISYRALSIWLLVDMICEA